jgi:hypothetical protein
MKRATLFVLLCLLLAAAGCGGGGGGSDKKAQSNLEARQSVVDALSAEAKLDAEARSTIAAMSAGSLSLQDGLAKFSEQTRNLITLIDEVASVPVSSNDYLARAQSRVESYLRQRVFQIESTLGAQSPQQVATTYDADRQALAQTRNDVRGLLFKYDPSLEKSVP